jgi:hypothetical protein
MQIVPCSIFHVVQQLNQSPWLHFLVIDLPCIQLQKIPFNGCTKLKMSSSKVIIRQLTTPSVNSPTHSPNNNGLAEPNSDNILNKQSRCRFLVLLVDINRNLNRQQFDLNLLQRYLHPVQSAAEFGAMMGSAAFSVARSEYHF